MAERQWTGLDEAQADGQACVICGQNFRVRGSVSVPVGRSHTGSQVFACVGRCAEAVARGEVNPPVHAVYDDMAALFADIPAARENPDAPPLSVPVEAIDTLCDASSGVFRAELAAAVRQTVAPLIVAAELRRLAEEVEGDALGHERLRERAAELDGGQR